MDFVVFLLFASNAVGFYYLWRRHVGLKKLQNKYGDIIPRDSTIQKLDEEIRNLQKETSRLKNEKSTLENQLRELEEEDFIQSHGFYESKYNFDSSGLYQSHLEANRENQKAMIKNKDAAVCDIEWAIDGDKAKGRKMISDYHKLVLRAFNGECDAAIAKVKYNNAQSLERRINRTFEALNKLARVNQSRVTRDFLKLKLEELYLTHEYQEKKQQEREEQRQIREQMREEQRALKEIEKAKEQAEREEKRYQESLKKAREELAAANEQEQSKLGKQVKELERLLNEAQQNAERAISRAQMTKSGHVYIISNIGSFGENTYKIGMTRRLEPLDRVKELGDASVPFPFDVHAMIFCENAPELEGKLHKVFSGRRLNKANERKEFFRVSLDEIIYAVQHIAKEDKLVSPEVRFTKIAEAEEYRKTLAMK